MNSNEGVMVPATLLCQMQNAAIDLAHKLGKAEAELASKPVMQQATMQQATMQQPVMQQPVMQQAPSACEVDLENPHTLKRSDLWGRQQLAVETMANCNTRESFKARRIGINSPQRTPALNAVERVVCREIQLIEQLKIARKALFELSNFGGEISTSREIADNAIVEIETVPSVI